MIELNVLDMTCGHCVRAIEAAVKEVDPQAQVRVDLATKQVAIESDTAPTIFVAALTEAGYSPVAL